MNDTKKVCLIPMDDKIREFDKHLRSHPRTILSARFGDGKSCFLTAAEKELKKYVFLKLYPVNYQVADNQDIFEYIKRDLLFQLYGKGMVPVTYEIPDSIASYFFLCNNWEKFAHKALQELSLFDASNATKTTLGAVKFLQSMKKKYDEFKKNGGELGVKLEHFMASFDDKGIYESDPITSILCDIIKDWKKLHSHKKVCLVFEDLDRIDPAHIFRILNVISAQVDYGYKYGASPRSNSAVGNKFGVDNIVVCLDYDNLENIFHHFYGAKTCFDGYINKFSDRGVFTYSLQEQVNQFYVNELARVTGMENKVVLAIMNKYDFLTYTLRQLYHAVDDIGKQISLPQALNRVVPHRGLFIMAAIMRRLGLSDEKIITIISEAFRSQPQLIGAYAATSMMLRRKIENGALAFSLGEMENGYILTYYVDNCNQDGKASVKKQKSFIKDPNIEECKVEDDIEFILRFVNK